jgi:hypothetical protein
MKVYKKESLGLWAGVASASAANSDSTAARDKVILNLEMSSPDEQS